jgi:hypothetical protein
MIKGDWKRATNPFELDIGRYLLTHLHGDRLGQRFHDGQDPVHMFHQRDPSGRIERRVMERGVESRRFNVVIGSPETVLHHDIYAASAKPHCQ